MNERKLRNRKKRNNIIRRRRRLLILGLLLCAITVLFWLMASWGMFDKKAESTTLTVRKDGSVVFEETDEASEDITEAELKDFVREQIDDFNEKAGKKDVRLIACEVNDKKTYLKTYYKDALVYASFTGLECFEGQVKDAISEGYLFNNLLVKVKDGKKGSDVSKSAIKKDGERRVIIINQDINVSLPSPCVYISKENTKLISDKTVSVDNPTEVYIVYD